MTRGNFERLGDLANYKRRILTQLGRDREAVLTLFNKEGDVSGMAAEIHIQSRNYKARRPSVDRCKR